jgi:hypothetical protein
VVIVCQARPNSTRQSAPPSAAHLRHPRPAPPRSAAHRLQPRPPPLSPTHLLHPRRPPLSPAHLLHPRPPSLSPTHLLHPRPPSLSPTHLLLSYYKMDLTHFQEMGLSIFPPHEIMDLTHSSRAFKNGLTHSSKMQAFLRPKNSPFPCVCLVCRLFILYCELVLLQTPLLTRPSTLRKRRRGR